MGISAWYVLRNRHLDVAKLSLRMAIVIAFAGSGLMFVSGDFQTREVQANQPSSSRPWKASARRRMARH